MKLWVDVKNNLSRWPLVGCGGWMIYWSPWHRLVIERVRHGHGV